MRARDAKADNKTVLVVDDEPLILQTLEVELKRGGYEVLVARDGKEALDILRERPVDLILADVMMPVMDGYTFCRKVKEDPKVRSIPFLFLSAKSSFEDKLKGYLLGAQRYITKPTTKQDLLQAVEVRLQGASLAQNLLRQRSRRIEGDLTAISVFSLLEFFYVGRWSGKITLTKAQEKGEILFKNAEIAGATLGRLHGEQALEQLLSWTNGHFLIERYSL